MSQNILLNTFETPYTTAPFSKIKNDDFLPAFKTAIDKAKKEIDVLVSILPGIYPENGDQRIIEGIKKRMGESVQVRFEHHDSIPYDASGKYRYVISKVAQNGF